MKNVLIAIAIAALVTVIAILTSNRVAPAREDVRSDTSAAAMPDESADSALALIGTGPADAPSVPGGGAGDAASAGASPGQPAATPSIASNAGEAALLAAAERYAGIRSLRADFTQRLENPLLESSVTSRGTIFQRRPDRFKMEFSDPSGDVIVSDGRYFWIYYPSIDAQQVIRASARAGAAGGVDLQSQFLGDPLRRFEIRDEGRAQVGGRAARVLVLTPRENLGYRRLKIWIDERDHLVRRFALTENNENVRHFDLRNVQVNVNLPDAEFRFTPPAKARVVEQG